MRKPQVIDRGVTLKFDTTDQGYMIAPASLARTGVQKYRNPDGSIRREYRPPDEVFAEDSLKTLELLPVTYEHPPEFLDSDNTKDLSIGTLGENIDRKGKWIKSKVRISDSGALEKIDQGVVEISMGYTRDLDWTSGVTPDGEEYDAIQRNIRYNHAALLPKGRAGSRLLIDAAEEITTEEKPVKKISLNGLTFEVDPQLADAFEADKQVADNLLEEALADGDKQKARADQAEEKLAENKKALDSALSEDVVQKRVAARLDLERKAKSVVDSAEDLSEKSDREVMVAVVQKARPNAKLEDASDAYIAAAFDLAIEDREDSLDKARKAADNAPASSLSTIDAARAKYLERNAARAANSLKGAK